MAHIISEGAPPINRVRFVLAAALEDDRVAQLLKYELGALAWKRDGPIVTVILPNFRGEGLGATEFYIAQAEKVERFCEHTCFRRL